MKMRSLFASVMLCWAPHALGQWTVVNLRPASLPPGYATMAVAVSGERQVGGAYPVAGGLWSGSAGSWVLLTPQVPGFEAGVSGTGGDEQCGSYTALVGGQAHLHAAIWRGTPGSLVDLHPPGAAGSYASGTDGVHEVGTTDNHACTWSGISGSWIDLHPPGALNSNAFGVSAAHQVGRVQIPDSYWHAALWTGSAASFVDLNPPGHDSSVASSVHGDEQVGTVDPYALYFLGRAALWRGTAESFVDLTPASAAGSAANGVFDGRQVGWVSFDAYGQTRHATLWSGTAGSWVDLHAFLPPEFVSSEAHGIWSDDEVIYVVGHGTNMAASPTGRNDALMWVRRLCGSADFDHDGSPGTDADIAAFFACLAGNCCGACGSADFDGDGDVGTDADIESFFRVLASGAC